MARKVSPGTLPPKPVTSESKWLARSVAAIATLLIVPFIYDAALWLFEAVLADEFPGDESSVVILLLFAFITMTSFFGMSMAMTMSARYGLLRLLTHPTVKRR